MSTRDMYCPHCNGKLDRYEPSPFSDWDSDLMICNNNECGYFTRGRAKVCKEYEKNFSYRYCVNASNGTAVPMAAWCYGELSLLKGRCSSQEAS